MNLNALRLFNQVAHHGSFSRAAVVTSISQPAVSRAVAELEAGLGHKLFDRGRRPLTLTPAGQCLFGHAETIFGAERQAHLELQAMALPAKRQLRIATSAVLAEHALAAPIARLLAERPGTGVRLTTGNLHDSAWLLGNAHADVAVVEGIVAGFEHLATTPWREQELTLLAPPDHPLAQETGPIDPARMNDYPFIHRETGSATGGFVFAFCEQYDIHPVRLVEAPSTATMVALVAAGIGLAIAPIVAAQAALAAKSLVRVSLRAEPLIRTMQIVRIESGHMSDDVRLFLEAIAVADPETEAGRELS